MSTQDLTQIINLLQSLGIGTQKAFVWYLVYKFVRVMLITVVFGLTFHRLFELISSITKSSSRLIILRDLMKVGAHGPVSEYEMQEMIEWVNDSKRLRESQEAPK